MPVLDDILYVTCFHVSVCIIVLFQLSIEFNSHSSGGLPLIVIGAEPHYIDAGKAAGGGDYYTCCKVTKWMTVLALVYTTNL